MKKVLGVLIAIIIIAALGAAGFYLYTTSTPEYSLKMTLEDVKASGVEGLKVHLTENMIEKVEQVEGFADIPVVSGLLSFFDQEDVVENFISELSEMDWEIKDMMRGKTQSEAILAFASDDMTGTIQLTLVKEGREWKIDSFEFQDFDATKDAA